MLNYIGDRAAMKQVILDGITYYRDNTISDLREISNDDGTVTLKAKAVDRFRFVLRPAVTVDPGQKTIVSSLCDCKNGRLGLCRHAVAVLLSIGEQVNVIPPDPAAPYTPPAPAKEEITVRVVHEGEPQAPVIPAPTIRPSVLQAAMEASRARAAAAEASKTTAAKRTKPAPVAIPEPEPEPAPVVPAAPEPLPFTPPGIRVRLGSTLSGDEPVDWTPNDTEQILHPNMGIIGTMGTGKTQFTKSLVYQLVREQRSNFGSDAVSVLIFDYKGDYNETKTDFVNATGARVLKPYRLPFNPLALVEPKTFKPLLPTHTANAIMATLAKIYRLGPKQKQLLLNCITQAYKDRGIKADDPSTWKRRPPTLDNVYRIYFEEAGEKAADSLTAAVSKLKEFRIFEDSPVFSGSLRDLMRGVVVIDLSGYDPDIQNLVVAITLDQFYAQMLSMGSSQTDGRYRQLRQLVLVDEADNFMKDDFPALRKILKEGREFGVGTVLSTQSLSHFIGGDDDYSRYMLTWVVHATSDLKQKDVEYIFKLPAKSQKTASVYTAVKRLEKHQSVVKISNDAPIAVADLPFWRILKDG